MAIEHGTRRGFQQHKAIGHRGIEVCEPCQQAQNAYMREYARATYTPEKRRAQYERAKARGYYDKETRQHEMDPR